jgi:hypothetical protein
MQVSVYETTSRSLSAMWAIVQWKNASFHYSIWSFTASFSNVGCSFLFFLFSLSFLGRVSCWPLKSILSFYFITFHIWPSMFWFLSLIFNFFFIKFQFVFNFIFEFIILIFNFLKFGPYFLCFYFLFGFFCKFYHLIQSLMIFNVRP